MSLILNGMIIMITRTPTRAVALVLSTSVLALTQTIISMENGPMISLR